MSKLNNPWVICLHSRDEPTRLPMDGSSIQACLTGSIKCWGSMEPALPEFCLHFLILLSSDTDEILLAVLATSSTPSDLLQSSLSLSTSWCKPGPCPHQPHIDNPFPILFRYRPNDSLCYVIDMEWMCLQCLCCSTER